MRSRNAADPLLHRDTNDDKTHLLTSLAWLSIVELMYNSTFVKYLSKKNRRPQQFYRDALSEIFAGIQEHLKEGKTIQFKGFGMFYTKTRKPSKIVHIKTKKTIDVPALRLAAFRVGSLLRQAVRGKQAKQRGLGALLKRAVRRKKAK